MGSECGVRARPLACDHREEGEAVWGGHMGVRVGVGEWDVVGGAMRG